MATQLPNGFMTSMGNGILTIEHQDDTTVKMWFACYDNPRPYVLGLTVNDLIVLANNMLELAKRKYGRDILD